MDETDKLIRQINDANQRIIDRETERTLKKSIKIPPKRAPAKRAPQPRQKSQKNRKKQLSVEDCLRKNIVMTKRAQEEYVFPNDEINRSSSITNINSIKEEQTTVPDNEKQVDNNTIKNQDDNQDDNQDVNQDVNQDKNKNDKNTNNHKNNQDNANNDKNKNDNQDDNQDEKTSQPKKSRKRRSKKHTQDNEEEEEDIAFKKTILPPSCLTSEESQAVRKLVSVFDEEVVGFISRDKLTAIGRYLENLITLCNTSELREKFVIEEDEDSDAHAERTGECIEFTDEENDEENDGYVDEGDDLSDFIASEGELDYESGYDSRTAKTKRLKRKSIENDEDDSNQLTKQSVKKTNNKKKIIDTDNEENEVDV